MSEKQFGSPITTMDISLDPSRQNEKPGIALQYRLPAKTAPERHGLGRRLLDMASESSDMSAIENLHSGQENQISYNPKPNSVPQHQGGLEVDENGRKSELGVRISGAALEDKVSEDMSHIDIDAGLGKLNEFANANELERTAMLPAIPNEKRNVRPPVRPKIRESDFNEIVKGAQETVDLEAMFKAPAANEKTPEQDAERINAASLAGKVSLTDEVIFSAPIAELRPPEFPEIEDPGDSNNNSDYAGLVKAMGYDPTDPANWG